MNPWNAWRAICRNSFPGWLLRTGPTPTRGQAQELPDGLILTGCPQLSGGSADSFGDHRIAMLAAVLAGGCKAPVTVLGAQCTSKSYPSFWQTLDTLKGDRT